jgi:hypothetical protein
MMEHIGSLQRSLLRWSADRQHIGGRLPNLLVGQYFAPRWHADAVLFSPIGNRNEYTLSVEHAPSEIDAAGAIFSMAMRALLLEEQGMASRDPCRIFQIGHLFGVRSPDCRAQHKHCQRQSRDVPHLCFSEKNGRRANIAHERPDFGRNYFDTLKAINVDAAGTFSSCGNNAGIRIAA